jgi:hypothetical protein
VAEVTGTFDHGEARVRQAAGELARRCAGEAVERADDQEQRARQRRDALSQVDARYDLRTCKDRGVICI